MKNIFTNKLTLSLIALFISLVLYSSNPDSLDFGDAPQGSYPVTLAMDGARHIIANGAWLGDGVDDEPDGQPSAGAVCDDNDCLYPSLGDDEDGIYMPSYVIRGTTVTIGYQASVNGFLDAWFDFSRTNGWAEPGEHILVSYPLGAGSGTISFTIPDDASEGVTYVRFRFRSDPSPLSFTGPASDGEVEDYAVVIEAPPAGDLDFGDAPEGINGYPTLSSSNGARHLIDPGVYLGEGIDFEPDGQPGLNADCDDNDCDFPSFGDDEDGILFPEVLLRGDIIEIAVKASVNGYLDGWMDFNHLNGWSEAGEHIFQNLPVVAGNNSVSFMLPSNAASGKTLARFRFRTDPSPISFTGLCLNGEVEDYAVTVSDAPALNYDFGDSPEENTAYPVTLNNNGARHLIVPGMQLGSLIDAETDGLQSADADSDDLTNSDDEDGISFLWPLAAGNPCKIKVTASSAGLLSAWIDFGRNGSWADPGEKVFSDRSLVAGDNYLNFMVPTGIGTGPVFARFRFSHDAGLSYEGFASDGEVEDYRVDVSGLGEIRWQQLPDTLLPGIASGANYRIADDWISDGNPVNGINWWGSIDARKSGEPRWGGSDHYTIGFYYESSCSPGSLITEFTVPYDSTHPAATGMVNVDGRPVYSYSCTIPQPLSFAEGQKYWISIRAVSSDPASPAWRWQEGGRWTQPVGCGASYWTQPAGWQPVYWPTPAPGKYSDMAFSVISNAKMLHMKAFLEGLYNPFSGMMLEASDENGPKWGPGTADKITVELHDQTNYSNVVSSSSTDLDTDGNAAVSIPSNLNGSYYITVRHRNSIETTSALPVSFAGSAIFYDFTNDPSKAYGGNQKVNNDGTAAIYGGDVNQDGIVDGGDMNPVDNLATAITFGYVPEDVNGDGIVDGGDMNIVDNNSTAIIMNVLP